MNPATYEYLCDFCEYVLLACQTISVLRVLLPCAIFDCFMPALHLFCVCLVTACFAVALFFFLNIFQDCMLTDCVLPDALLSETA